jgi:hypothetical protein
MKQLAVALIFNCSCISATAMGAAERKELLDALRPSVAKQAGQPVRFKVSKLNQDQDWAILVGELLAEQGKVIDWSKAKGCDTDLDKMLYVVAHKAKQGWRVKQMDICAPEPPYWNLNPEVDYAHPCGIYVGLEITVSETAEQRCLAYQAQKRSAKK